MGIRSWARRTPPLLCLALVCTGPALQPANRGVQRAHAAMQQRPAPGAVTGGIAGTRTPPHPAFQSVQSRVVASQGLAPAPGGWRAGRQPASLTLRLPTLPPESAGIALTGRLVGRGAIGIRVGGGRTWHAAPLEEPSERDLPGAFAVWLEPGAAGDQVRLTVGAADARGVVLRDVRFDAQTQAATPAAAATPAGALPGVRVISRLDWGNPDGETSPRWIPFYQQPFHIIVHHTAAPPGSGGPIADMQAIWHFHTFDRAWGDIGYNYVIDPSGHIYEGRAGGSAAVAGHTHGFNPGAIGIALIGDYNQARPSAAMVRALQSLITALANRYGIDVLSTGTDQGLRFDLLAGHRDFNLTDCPGTFAYALLPALRAAVAKAVRNGVAPAGPSVAQPPPASASTALLVVRNTGTTTWNGRYTLRLRGLPPYGLPGRYNLPDTSPGALATVPLFLPPLPAGTVRSLHWDLYDAAGVASGSGVALTLDVPPATKPSPTPTPPATASAQPTVPSATTTPTASATTPPSPTATDTPSASETTTPSSTASATPSPTPSPTATRTATSTATPTATPTATTTHPPLLRLRGSDTPVPPLTPHAGTTALSGTPQRHSPELVLSQAALFAARLSDPTAVGDVPAIRPQSEAPMLQTMRADAALEADTGTLMRRSLNATGLEHGGALPAVAATPGTLAAPTAGLADTWYFAAGSSGQRDGETIAVLNPGSRPAYLLATVLRQDGRRIFLADQAPPASGATIDVGFAAGRGGTLGVVLRSTEPVAAERTITHASPALDGTAAALTPGYVSTSPVWYLPRLPLARDETERLSLLNPNAAAVTVAVSAVTYGQLRPYALVRLAPLSTRPLTLPFAVSSAVVRVVAPAGAGIVAEAQTSYSADRGATVVAGLPSLSTDGYLPGPSGGTHEYAVLLNPHPEPADVTLTGRDAQGRAMALLRVEVAAGGQAAVDLTRGRMGARSVLEVRASLPIAAGYAGMLGRVEEPTIAALYHGSAVTAWAQPARTIRFAAGDTWPAASGPREALAITNPSDAIAQVTLTIVERGQAQPVRNVIIAPRATVRLDLNGPAPSGRHGLILRSTTAVVAWHSIDLNRGAIRLLSPGIDGD